MYVYLHNGMDSVKLKGRNSVETKSSLAPVSAHRGEVPTLQLRIAATWTGSTSPLWRYTSPPRNS
jgi:hypothetical protein